MTICGAATVGPTCSSCSFSTLARPTALPLRLRGGATDNGDGDDCPIEIGGVRPEAGADVDPEGERMEFHSIKEGQLEALRSGDLQVSEELKARKKDKDSFAKVPYVTTVSSLHSRACHVPYMDSACRHPAVRPGRWMRKGKFDVETWCCRKGMPRLFFSKDIGTRTALSIPTPA